MGRNPKQTQQLFSWLDAKEGLSKGKCLNDTQERGAAPHIMLPAEWEFNFIPLDGEGIVFVP